MKNNVTLAIVGLLVSLLLMPGMFITQEKDLNTDKSSLMNETRSTLFVGPGQTYLTISSAISAAGPSDTIRVFNGTYHEKLVIGKTLSLIGNGSESTRIIGDRTGDVVIVKADWSIIRGFKINGSDDSCSGISVQSNFSTIENCNCSDNYFCIMVSGYNNTISNNTCISNTKTNGYGICLSSCVYNCVNNNTCDSNKIGLALPNTGGNVITANRFRSNQYGIKGDHSNSKISNNTFVNNTYGISLFWSQSGIVNGNNFLSNANGIINSDNDGQASTNNKFYQNNFISNSVQAKDNALNCYWYTNSIGNYWSNWVSPDSDDNGIVDTPYHLVGDGNRYDYYPLVEPFGRPEINMTPIQYATEDVEFSLQAEAIDNNTPVQLLQWSLRSNASWLTLSSSRCLCGLPSNSDVGAVWANITASDGVLEGFRNVTIIVSNVNDPPEIMTSPLTTINEHEFYLTDFNSTDIDPTGDILVWSLETDADFLRINTTTGLLSGTPENANNGPHWVNVIVNDGKGGSDSINFTLEVLPVNDAPLLNAPLSNLSFDEDTVNMDVRLSDWFQDNDSSNLEFRCVGNINLTVTIMPNGTVRLVPKANWSGIETLSFFANDTEFEAAASLQVTVLPVNDAPFNASIRFAEIEYYQGGPQPAFGNASDVDLPYGDDLTFTWSSNKTGTIWTGLEVNLSLPAEHYRIILNVSDSEGAFCLAFANVTILGQTIMDDDITDDDIINISDSDKDGLPDWWEMKYFNNLSYGSGDDPDKDGLDNLQEFQQKKDPTKSDIDIGDNTKTVVITWPKCQDKDFIRYEVYISLLNTNFSLDTKSLETFITDINTTSYEKTVLSNQTVFYAVRTLTENGYLDEYRNTGKSTDGGDGKDEGIMKYVDWKSITGTAFSLVSILVGALIAKRKLSRLRRILDQIDQVYEENKNDPEKCRMLLIQKKKEYQTEVLKGKLAENKFLIIKEKINDHLCELKEMPKTTPEAQPTQAEMKEKKTSEKAESPTQPEIPPPPEDSVETDSVETKEIEQPTQKCTGDDMQKSDVESLHPEEQKR